MKSECFSTSGLTVASVQGRFEHWRKTRNKRKAIPDALWALAVELTQQHSICQVAEWLKLNYTSLKQRVDQPAFLIRSDTQTSTFVEIPSMVTHNAGHCQIDIKRSDGSQMQIQLPDGFQELPSLVRAFLG